MDAISFESRFSTRYDVNFRAEITIDNKPYSAIITNINRDGVLVEVKKDALQSDLEEDAVVQIAFDVDSNYLSDIEQPFRVNCGGSIVWSIPRDDIMYIGVYVYSLQYHDFYDEYHRHKREIASKQDAEKGDI